MNKLTGSIPTELGYLTNLNYANFYHNQLSHTIPTQLGLLLKISTLELLSNSLTGTVPSAFCADELLSVFSFGSNALSCYAPCLSSVTSLQNGVVTTCTDTSVVSNIPTLKPTSKPVGRGAVVYPSTGEISL